MVKAKFLIIVALCVSFAISENTFAQVAVDPLLVDFGTAYYGDVVSAKNITLTNNGIEAVKIISAEYSNTSFATFVAQGDTRLQAGDNFILRVKPTESYIGAYAGSLTFKIENQNDVVVDLRATIAARPAESWMFYFTREEVNIDCTAGSDYCEASVPFEVSSNNGCLGYANPIDFSRAVAADIELKFNPCSQVLSPDLMGDPSYSRIYEEKYGGCDTETRSECTIVAKFQRLAISLISEDCHLRGEILFTISGVENVAQCTNLKVSRKRQKTDPGTGAPVFAGDGVTPVMELYDFYPGESFFQEMSVTAQFPVLSGSSRPDNVRVAVTRLDATPVENNTDLHYYSAFIKTIAVDNTVPSLDFALRFKDGKGGFVALPSNIVIEKIDWTADGVIEQSSSGIDAYQFRNYVYASNTEPLIRAVVSASYTNKAGVKQSLLIKSNELRLYTPNKLVCKDGTPPKVYTVPPVMRPERAPTRPIYTNVSNFELPDYTDYAGDGDLTYVQAGWWHGGAAKNGVWDPWINDNSERVGRKTFTFNNALPWEIYQLCPISDVVLPENPQNEQVVLDGTNFGYYNACADPNKLVCPVERDGSISWNLTWTVYGWLCIRNTCLLLPDVPMQSNAGEAWGCDE
ncbi:MAG: hypothetical protein V2B19_16410 [Pseudomonadota bacterium]